MHPEILRELSSQRGREMRDRAEQGRLASTARKARRARRHGLSGPADADAFILPAIPDYVDGSFSGRPGGDKMAGQHARVSSTGRAA